LDPSPPTPKPVLLTAEEGSERLREIVEGSFFGG